MPAWGGSAGSEPSDAGSGATGSEAAPPEVAQPGVADLGVLAQLGVLARLGVLALLGVAIGAVAAFAQAYTTWVGGVGLPTGTVLALLTIVPVARAAAWWPRTRAGAVAFASGWLLITLLMGTTTQSGDLVLTSGTRQIGYLVGGTLLLAAACAFPLLPADDRFVEGVA